MNISIANLISQAVKTASGLHQQSRDNGNQGIAKAQRAKAEARLVETKRTPVPSSAYRVTISQAALQKMQAANSPVA